jgi:2-iminobutanoate/2-iminopropanoate deaminase
VIHHAVSTREAAQHLDQRRAQAAAECHVPIGCLVIHRYADRSSRHIPSGTARKEREMQVQPVEITPDPYEPFLLAQAHRVGELLFVSGQAGIGADGQIVRVGDFDEQAEQAFRNLDRVLRAGGSSLANVVKVTIFVTDMADFGKVVELRRRWFTRPYPADTIVEVSSLFSPDAMFEIEAIAVVDDAADWADHAEDAAKSVRRGPGGGLQLPASRHAETDPAHPSGFER